MKPGNFKMYNGADWNLDVVAKHKSADDFIKAHPDAYPAHNPAAKEKIMKAIYDDATLADSAEETAKPKAEEKKETAKPSKN